MIVFVVRMRNEKRVIFNDSIRLFKLGLHEQLSNVCVVSIFCVFVVFCFIFFILHIYTKYNIRVCLAPVNGSSVFHFVNDAVHWGNGQR